MSRLRPLPLLTAAGGLAVVGLTLKLGLDPLLAGEGANGAADVAGNATVVLAGACALLALALVEPAWPLSIGIAAMIFSGNWDLAGSPIALDRILILVGLLSLLLRARSPRDVLGSDPSAIHWLLAVVALYGLSSAVLSGTADDRIALFGLLDRFGVVPFVLFAVAPAVFPDERRRRILLGTLTVVGAYLVYVSILGRLGPSSLVFPDYIVDPTVGIHPDRARGPFVEAGANGLALFGSGVAAALFGAAQTDRRIRLAAIAVALGCAFCIVLTLTRSVWIASALALIAAMLATSQTRRLLVPVAVTAALGVVIALAVVPGLSEDVDFRNNDDRPIWDRNNANAAAIRMVAERPLVGFGWFTFQTESDNYQRLSDDHILTRSGLEEHNVFLSNAVELGLIGTLLWAVALFSVIGVAAFRRGPPELKWWRVGLIAIAVQWLVVANFVPLGYAFPTALLWLWAGVAWARPTAETDRPAAEVDRNWLSKPVRPAADPALG